MSIKRVWETAVCSGWGVLIILCDAIAYRSVLVLVLVVVVVVVLVVGTTVLLTTTIWYDGIGIYILYTTMIS